MLNDKTRLKVPDSYQRVKSLLQARDNVNYPSYLMESTVSLSTIVD